MPSGDTSRDFSARRRFAPGLRRVSAALELEEPLRSRVLLELAADLEAAYEHFRAQGICEEEATQLAEERVLVSPAALRRLVRVHQSGWWGWAGWAHRQVRRGIGLLLLLGGVLPAVLVAAGVLLPQLQPSVARPALWVVLALGGGALWVAGATAHRLLHRHEAPLMEARAGLDRLLFLGLVIGTVGVLDALLATYVVAERIATTPASAAEWGWVAEALGGGGTVLGASILLAMGTGALWLPLAERLARLEQAERVLLLDE